MPTTNDSNNILNLDVQSLTYKVYHEFFVINNKNRKEIAQKFNTSEGSVNAVISKLKRKLIVDTSTLPQEELVGPCLDTPNNKKSLILKIYEIEETGKVVLFVKTCKEFEDYLIKNKEVHESENLWAQGKKGKFYQLKIVEGYNDDVNRPIIRDGIINFAVLRVPGISKGVEYTIDGLLTQKQLEVSARKLVTAFNGFYKSKIIAQKINIEATGEIENDN